ncbi:TDT family transporter [Pseudomonas sp. GWSMS-1]|uniref:TDT family transporter n=1 Tax=Pseudomonas sp. GWSMS-1 TaxID=3308997 RepID=UPI003CEFA2EF
MLRPFTRLHEPLAFVRQFTPNWFAMTMGTGVLAQVVARLPVSFTGQLWLAEGLWLLTVLLFGLFSLLFVARLLLFRDTLWPMLDHPVQSMFLGAIPMGLVQVVNGLLLFAEPMYGAVVVQLAHGLWWLALGLALGVALGVPYLMFTRQKHVLETLTGVWLLPIVAPEVVASGAAVLAPHLPAETAQLLLSLGYVLWGLSLSLAFALIALVLLRLALHKLPDMDFAASSWLPLGPLATGCLGLIGLGQAAPQAWQGTALQGAAEMAQQLGLVGGLALWGAGLWWLVAASLFTQHYMRRELPFNLGWWGFTFPLGVFTLATFALQQLTGLAFFTWVGLLLAAKLTLIWLLVMRHTLRGLWHGELFQAPCLCTAKPV